MRKLAAFLVSAGVLAAPAFATPGGTRLVLIADSDNNRIRVVNSNSGIIDTFAGNGVGSYAGDGGAATSAELHHPTGVAVDSSNNVYIADNLNNRIRKVAAGTRIITTIAGTGAPGYAGDGGQATSAQLNGPYGVTVGPFNILFIADTNNHVIRAVDLGSGLIRTVAGNGLCCFAGDGGSPTSARLYHPSGVTVDDSLNFFIADTGNNRIREIGSDGNIHTYAGTGAAGFACNAGQLGVAVTSVALHSPTGIIATPGGAVYIADSGNECVRAGSGGSFFSEVGNGTPSFGGDGGIYLDPSVELNDPTGVAWAAPNFLYIADNVNHRVRVIVPDGTILTFAGNGTAGFSGDGGPATDAQLYNPAGVAILIVAAV